MTANPMNRDEAVRVLEEVRRLLASTPSLQGREYDDLGIRFNNALTALRSGGGEDAGEGYFAATPGEGSFDIFSTLEEAKVRAMDFLEWERDEAADGGWKDEPPQVCYGIVLGRCEEVPGSRRPADPQTDPDEFTEIVDFRLTNLDRDFALPHPQPARGEAVANLKRLHQFANRLENLGYTELANELDEHAEYERLERDNYRAMYAEDSDWDVCGPLWLPNGRD